MDSLKLPPELDKLLSDLISLRNYLRDDVKFRFNRVNPFVEDLFSWEEKGRKWSGKDCVIYDSATIVGDVEIGNNVWVGPFCNIDGTGKLKIGEGTTIASGCQILTHDTVKSTLSKGRHRYEYSFTSIGKFCFIGTKAVVLRGTTIGDHCLVGACSLINESFPSFSIIVGSPAKRVGEVLLTDNDVELIYY